MSSITYPLEMKIHNCLFTTEQIFTNDECDFLIEKGHELGFKTGKVVDDKGNYVESESRNVGITFVPIGGDVVPFYSKFTHVIKDLNSKFFNFKLDTVELIQISRYEEGQYYDWHFDSLTESPFFRKLSISIQLSDPKDYEGGDLFFQIPQEVTTPKTRGSVTIFPSYIRHKASEVTKGERYSLVSWICGPPFK